MSTDTAAPATTQSGAKGLNTFLLATATGVFIFFMIRHYVLSEDNAYYWDYQLYWRKYVNFGALFWTDADEWRRKMVLDIYTSNYNEVFTAFLLPFSTLFGGKRLWYIEATGLTFMWPAILTTYYGMRKIIKNAVPGQLTPSTTKILFLWTLLYFPFWSATLRGFPDISGIIFLSAATTIILSGNIVYKQRLADIVLTGLFLYFPFLLRKWYAFSIIAVYSSGFCYSLYLSYHHQPDKRLYALADTAIRFIVIALLVGLLLFFFQAPLLYQAMGGNFNDTYVAYQATPLNHALGFYDFFGWPLLLLSIVGCYGAFTGQRKLAPVIVYFLACLLITVLLFTRLQQFYIQHFLPVGFFLLFLSGYGVVYLLSLAGERVTARRPAMLAMALLALVMFTGDLGLLPSGTETYLAAFAPQKTFPPLKYPVGNDYAGLVADLERLLLPKYETCSVFSSSPIMSDSLLAEVSDFKLGRYITLAANVDRRDVIYSPAFLAHYTVVTDPAQTHLAPADQEVIVIPNNLILQGVGIGAAYKRIASHALGGGATAYIYEKTRPFTSEEVKAFLDTLYVRYPQWKAPYNDLLTKKMLSARYESGLESSW